ncbi:MAG: hypothetical protein DRG78_09260 [Epsilonproteobacteria bacterium]|nr:MAG: hypothetical protein DRG78_09260 [Campylobacterota bacterium]
MNENIYIKFLNLLEEIEYQSIQWGYTEGILTEDEIYDKADDFINNESNTNINSDDLIGYLEGEKLIFEVTTLQGQGYRTRFGEAIHLLTNIRQIFGKRTWQESPKLVSDFRVKLQKRFYPKREVSPTDTLLRDELSNLSYLQKEIWNDLTKDMTLAKFQENATCELLKENSVYNGVIVTAGTGSGKTLSFYLPALLKIVDSIQKDDNNWTRVIAAYPRVELLRDQFSEAIQQSLSISNTLKNKGIRPIKVGALYGAIPNTASTDELQRKGWKRNIQDTGWICPIINCPYTNTELIWLDTDIEQNNERLVPNKQIDGAITLTKEYIILTRTRMMREAPDLLFTTLEMINQRLSDSKVNRLFGIRRKKEQRPFLMLLDEVHTYTGTTGAQASMVLKRWKQAVITPVKFVGLSATLNEAERFFSELTGIYENKVIEITPQSDEMIEEGSEYQIILKSDPVNKTSLLSTTIQAIMLIGRILNPVGSIEKKTFKEVIYGEKVFAFSDDLDVTNRLFDDLKDAEGWNIFNQNDSKSSSLAMLRKKDTPIDKFKVINGQDWRVCEDIGHKFNGADIRSKLKISRTSSQDTGVDTTSAVVVATASLEVGFNDPTVGAVIQHKAPYNWANFLQRKGRAGRKRGTKPFMITTLSDFGRDRIAFNHYEYFFNPIIPVQRLPIYNRYILKIQAVTTLFDWLSKQISVQQVWMFNLLSKPMLKESKKNKEAIVEILKLLNQLLDQNSLMHKEFIQYLGYALGINNTKNINEILWSSPRSLLLEVIPTLIRRLTTNWKLAFPKDDNEYEGYVEYLPLPEFITPTLFSDLALPEVKVIVELDQDQEKPYNMPLQQTIREFAPGRISRRFASQRGNLHHWIPISIDEEYQTLEIKEYATKYEYVNTVLHNDENISIFRPHELKLEKNTIQNISKKSNSILNWNTKFIVSGEPISVYLSKQNSWSNIINSIEFFVHSHNSNTEIIRYSTGATANLSFKGGQTFETEIEFLDEGKSSSIGFSFNADAMYFKYKVPTLTDMHNINLNPELIRELKLEWFKDQVMNDIKLPKQITTFEKNWLQEVISNAIIVLSSTQGISLQKSNEKLKNDSEIIFEILSEMFNTDMKIEDEDEKSEDQESKLFSTLNELLRDSDIRLRLHNIFENTVLNDNQEWYKWLRNSLHSTFANTLLFACESLTPNQSSIDTLLIDPVSLDDSDIGEIWLSESSAGGVGVIDELVNIIAQDPTSLFKSISATTQLSDYELVVDSLEQFIYLLQEDDILKNLALNICQVKSHNKRQELLNDLYIKLTNFGISMGHSFKVALNTRLLKEGVDSRFFDLVYELIQWRDEFEEKINLAIDLKLFCFIVVKQDIFRTKLESLNLNSNKDLINTANLLSNILWTRSFEARQQHFQSYSPFRQNQFNDPKLIKQFILNDNIQLVEISDTNWQDRTIKLLEKYSVCKLKIKKEQKDIFFKESLSKLLAQPIDIDFLQLYIMIDGVEKSKDHVSITLRLREEV